MIIQTIDLIDVIIIPKFVMNIKTQHDGNNNKK
jgi:hypothetical protein